MPRTSLRKTLLPLVIVAAVVLALGVAYYLKKRAVRRELGILYATLRAQGRPVTPEDLVGPPIPDSENAATLYDRAFAKLPILSEAEDDLLYRLLDTPPNSDTSPPTPEDWNRARKILDRFDESLSLIEQGLARPQYRFNADWSNYSALFTAFHTTEQRHVARMLFRRSQLRLHDGDLQRSIHDVHTSLQFCASLQSQPLTIPWMTRCATERMLLEHLGTIVSEHCLDRETLDFLDQDIERLSAGGSLNDALAGERVLFAHLFRCVREGRSPVDVLYPYTALGTGIQRTVERIDAMRLRMRLDEEELYLMRSILRLEHIAQMPVFNVTDEIDELNEGIESSGYVVPTFLSTRLLEWNFDAERCALLLIASAWLAAERHRLDHGRFPKQLPGDFVDPFDGKPLRYSLEDGALRIWSVGHDLDDDGGAPWDPRTRDGDIVWPTATTPRAADVRPETPPNDLDPTP